MSLLGFAVGGFLLTFLSVFFCGLGLMDGKKRTQSDSYYVNRAYKVSTIAVAVLGLLFGGLFGIIGAAVGAGVTWALLLRNK